MARLAAAFSHGKGHGVTHSSQIASSVIASNAKQSRLGDCGGGFVWIASLSLAMTNRWLGLPASSSKRPAVHLNGLATRNVSPIFIPSCMSCDHRRAQPARVAAAAIIAS